MSEEETNFIVITKIKEFAINDIAPMSVAFCYPLLAIATSSSHIVTFDFETKITTHLERQKTGEDNVVLCSDVSPDKTHIATGHSDGEVVLWSLQSKTVVLTTRISEPVSYISFASTFTIFIGDSNGALCRSIFSQIFFKKSVSTNLVYNFGQPLTALAFHDNFVYVSTSTHTFAFSLLPDFHLEWSDESPASCFAFLDTPQTKYVARGVGHSVIITNNSGNVQRVVQFSQTPSVVSLLDEDSVLVLFNGAYEMDVNERRFRRHVPLGRALAAKDKIYIAGTELMQLSLASVQQRVDNYIQEGNWKMAFAQIQSSDDITDLLGMLHQFVASPQFDATELFNTVERLNITDFVVLMMFTKRREEILQAFIKSGKTNWKLTLEFILEVANSTTDDQLLINFLSTIELNLDWLRAIFSLCFERGFHELMAQLALEYCGDTYLALQLGEYSGDTAQIFHILELVMSQQETGQKDCIKFLSTSSLVKLVRADEDRAGKILWDAIEVAPNYGGNVEKLINNIVSALDYDSRIWPQVAPILIKNKYTLEKPALEAVIRYVFYEAGNPNIREDLFISLLETNQISKPRDYLPLSRSSSFSRAEIVLVKLLHDPDELLAYIVGHHLTEFSDQLKSVTDDEGVIKKFLTRHCRMLIAINADEFVQLVWSTHDEQLFTKINSSFSNENACQWHFLSRMFKYDEYYAIADEASVTAYITMLARFRPDEMLSALKRLPSLPVERALSVAIERGIADATLYLCAVTYDIEKATEFGTSALLTALMDGEGSVIINEITEFLNSCAGRPEFVDLWVRFMAVFQLPLYATMEDPPKQMEVVRILATFVQSMILVVDPVLVSEQFARLFSFLPFRAARPVLTTFFKAIREKNEFSQTFSAILKNEEIKKELDYTRSRTRAREYDAARCAQCGQRLGMEDVFAAQCGHVFHVDCTKSGWCPICSVPFPSDEAPPRVETSKIIADFEESLRPKVVQQGAAVKPLAELLKPVILERPRIGIQPRAESPPPEAAPPKTRRGK